MILPVQASSGLKDMGFKPAPVSIMAGSDKAQKGAEVNFWLILWRHPCITPLYLAGISHFALTLVYGKFISQVYVGQMTNARGRHARGDASALKNQPTPLAGPILHSQSVTGVLEEATPATVLDQLPLREEWQLVCRVAASKDLSRSGRLAKFLLYVCEQYLLGNAGEITEQRIGTTIFNRPAGYDPGEDNIVRSYARTLRKRLETYFAGEGLNEAMRIVIPRGGYVPVFLSNPGIQAQVSAIGSEVDSRERGAPAKEPVATSNQTPKAHGEHNKKLGRRRPWRGQWISSLAGAAAGALLASAGWLGVHALQLRREQGPAHAVWAQLFQENRNTLIVAADSGLGILQNLTRRLVDVNEYANGSFLAEMQPPPGMDERNLNDLRRQRYTSVVCLNIASELTRLPEFIANRTEIRYARSVTADDIKNSNVILLGSKHTNPWVSLFEKRLNFTFEYLPEVDDSYVLNEHPSGTEEKIYRNGVDETSNRTYGTIAYLPDLDGAGHVLIIQGLNMAGTQAAADTLFDVNIIKPVLQQAALPNGKLRPFELLVETTSIGATAPGAQLIATRIYPQ